MPPVKCPHTAETNNKKNIRKITKTIERHDMLVVLTSAFGVEDDIVKIGPVDGERRVRGRRRRSETPPAGTFYDVEDDRRSCSGVRPRCDVA